MCLIIQSYPTLCNLMGCSLPGSSVHGILQARTLEWLTIPSPGNLLQGSNPGLLQCRWILYCLSHQRSPSIYLHTPQSMTQITPRPDLSPMTDRSLIPARLGPQKVQACLHASPHADSQPGPSPRDHSSLHQAVAFSKAQHPHRKPLTTAAPVAPSSRSSDSTQDSHRLSLKCCLPHFSISCLGSKNINSQKAGERHNLAQRLQVWILESKQPRSATFKHETFLNRSEAQNSRNKNNDSSYHTGLIQRSNDIMHVKQVAQ